MKIKNIRHKGLKKLFIDGDKSGVPANMIKKLTNMLAFLQNMESPEELKALPTWNAHQLKGKLKGTWSLTVSANWRLTFLYDPNEDEIYDIDLEDYH